MFWKATDRASRWNSQSFKSDLKRPSYEPTKSRARRWTLLRADGRAELVLQRRAQRVHAVHVLLRRAQPHRRARLVLPSRPRPVHRVALYRGFGVGTRARAREISRRQRLSVRPPPSTVVVIVVLGVVGVVVGEFGVAGVFGRGRAGPSDTPRGASVWRLAVRSS